MGDTSRRIYYRRNGLLSVVQLTILFAVNDGRPKDVAREDRLSHSTIEFPVVSNLDETETCNKLHRNVEWGSQSILVGFLADISFIVNWIE